MRKSRSITLVLLTSSLFFGCEDKVRNQYASWDDCVNDYQDKTKCESQNVQTAAGYHTYYYGPWYRPSGSSDSRVNPSSSSRRSIGIVRGGFGSMGFHAGS
jgi:hypothetical protein